MEDNALGTFLRARRERVAPAEVGFNDLGRRRTPGLRREEVALLADLSVTYYIRLEQGRDRRPSADVVASLSRALRLDDAGGRYLRTLAGLAPEAAVMSAEVRPQLRRLLERHVDTPAYVVDPLATVLAANAAAMALHPSYRPGANLLRDLFLDPATRAYHPADELPQLYRNAVATVRAARLDADHPLIAALLDNADFAALWASHEVIEKRGGVLRLEHPGVGSLELDAEVFEVSGAAGQRLIVLHAAPGSESERGLVSLRR